MAGVALLECGSNSLKVHFRHTAGQPFQSLKFPWQLGRDVFESGVLSEETLAQAIVTVQELARMGFQRKAMVAIATEGFRDARNQADLLGQLRDRLQLPVRVISGREEASLLAEGYSNSGGKIPAFLVDIGGGSVQLVHISAEKNILRDSLPLGAIRLHCLGEEEGKSWNRAFVEDFIESQLETGCLMPSEEVQGTGGTVKAATKVLEMRRIPRAELDSLVDRVDREGPPPDLKPHRRAVFLPGLLILSKLMERTGAAYLRYVNISVGRIFLQRVLDRLGPAADTGRRDYLVDQMRITNIRPRL